ncbi:MAG: DUF3102 domain-containing protein [Candidatus Paceibacterota bacterium]
MENLAIVRTPELIAAEINGIKAQTRNLILYNQIEIGRKLTEAKSLLEHGEWGSWLEGNVDYSKSTANNLMNLFDEYGSSQITLLSSNIENPIFEKLSYSQAVALLGLPEEERAAFVEGNNVESMSTRELQKQVDGLKEKLENAKNTAIEKCNEAKELKDEKFAVESELRTTDQCLREQQANVKMLQDTLKTEREKKEKIIEELQSKIVEANASGNTQDIETLHEAMKVLDGELSKAKEKANELEKQLKEQPIEAAATIKKIPEEVERELEELRGKQVDEAVIKFNLFFETARKAMSDLVMAADSIKDTATKEKYRGAAKKFLGILQEKM